MWVRSTMTYRASFALLTFGNLATTALDFAAILIMFSHVDQLGGLALPEVAFLYATSTTAFGLADLFLGSFDRIGSRIRDGTFDTLLVRPVPVLAQIAADRFALRRLGRITQGAVVLGWSVTAVDVAWTPENILLTVLMPISGAVIFGCFFVAGGAFQLWAQDAAEVQNAFTYGGTTLLQYPPAVFGRELVRGVTFVVPLAFVNWLPALRVLGHEDPLGLPGWVDWAAPGVAVLCCALTGLLWRAALRGYRSTGS
ncbi:transporter [Streptomyces sp. AJS327]|uniref:ABC transporter permease n=1 Tax=Streptomyces sp. AJS327 TaxID=2545265 RepID=UPI0015DF5F9A|nr:ABC transporter permease [Streptomyces sp. AJS327]MBA0049599.1 transporter [Streptomyces sp. AJS327]